MRKKIKVTAFSLIFVLGIYGGTLAQLAPVPDTGQTTCYNNSSGITCPEIGGAFHGQDACYDTDKPFLLYQPEDPEYDPNDLEKRRDRFAKLDAQGADLPADATAWVMVRDNLTGLTWEVKTSENYDDRLTWEEADEFVGELNSDKLGGHSDWRLPTVSELAFIIDRGTHSPAISREFFSDITALADSDVFYWSSTIEEDDPSTDEDESANVFYVDLRGGKIDSFSHLSPSEEISFYLARYKRHIRAVRGRNTYRTYFVNNGDGTITDRVTGLMWQEKPPYQLGGEGEIYDLKDWKSSLAYCEELDLSGYDDWHLPDINELVAMVDYAKKKPALDTAFSGGSTSYWSSTTRTKDNMHGWYVNLDKGSLSYGSKTQTNYVRAVRGPVETPLDLSDVIIALKIVAGFSKAEIVGEEGVLRIYNVDDDGKIGIKEVIDLLQYLAKL